MEGEWGEMRMGEKILLRELLRELVEGGVEIGGQAEKVVEEKKKRE